MATTTLPRWDVSDVFPSLQSRELTAAKESLTADVTRLVSLYDEAGIADIPVRAPTADDVAGLERAVEGTNAVLRDHTRLSAYALSFIATDSRNDDAQALASTLEVLGATLRQLSARLAAWIAALGPNALVDASPVAADHAYPIVRAAARAEHQMPGPEERLYAELAVTGSTAWARLYMDVTSQLTAVVRFPDGRDQTLPITAVRGLATHHDPAARRAAFDAELAAWPTVAVPCSAALNAIKGEANTVNSKRGWADALEASLFANAVDGATFAAMQAAVDTALPDFRRWLRTKAARHGSSGGLAWWDLTAPLSSAPSAVAWEDGCERVAGAFATYSAQLSGLVARAVGERWIDVGPREGKRGGAFCASLTDDRSLVMLNWDGSVDAVQTLAHELGHAYHNTQLAGRTPLQRQVPMALAETASIFCETLLVAAMLTRASGPERLALLDTDLAGATQVIVDIRSRLLFETEVFRRRRERTLAPAELCTLMTDAQKEAYGDGLDHGTLHPYMWAVKPHYYGSHFYNWPYTYGLLFGLGLFASFQRDPDRFRSGYDDLLGAAGIADAATLGRRFGLDVRDEAFWTASLDVLRERIAEYERLASISLA
jgi:pepF/M3 family oligoendopeptidase